MLHALTRYRVFTPTDPYWANVVALLHFNGSDHSSSYIDQTGRTWTIGSGSSSEISTNKSMFGGASLFVYPSVTYGGIRTAASSDFNFGTADFTIEWWNNLDDAAIYQTSFGIGYVGSGELLCQTTSTSSIAIYISGSSVMSTSAAIITGVWTHYALVKDSGVLRFYINGVQAASVTNGTSISTSNYISIGGRNLDSTYPTRGYIDDFRVTNGVCRYPSGTTFPVPLDAFPNA